MPPADITIQTDQIITQVGLVAESSAQPVLINSVVASGSLETDTLLDKYGDIGARAWGKIHFTDRKIFAGTQLRL